MAAFQRVAESYQAGAVQVDPIKLTLKSPGTKRVET
jgi:hypothetical protein